MGEELVGHITSNPNKIKVLEILKSKKESEIKSISKFTRIPLKILETVVGELKKDDIVKEEKGKLLLTEKGIEILNEIKSI
jgi:predicted transcriptional regulator